MLYNVIAVKSAVLEAEDEDEAMRIYNAAYKEYEAEEPVCADEVDVLDTIDGQADDSLEDAVSSIIIGIENQRRIKNMDMITALSMAVKLLQEEEERNLSNDDIPNAMVTRHAYLQINDLVDNLKAIKETEEG